MHILGSYVKRMRAFLSSDDWSRLAPRDILYVAGDNDRRYAFQGRMYAPLIDSVQDTLSRSNLSGLTIASPIYSIVTHPQAHGYVLRFNRSFAFAAVNQRIAAKMFRADDSEKYRVALWTRILSKVQPRAVIGIQPPRELCVACRNLGIFVADLQHGVISDEWYYGRKHWEQGGKTVFPNCFLLWDQASSLMLKQSLQDCPSEHLIIGNPWIQRFIASPSRDNLVKEAQDRLTGTSLHGKNSILLTMQWGSGISDISQLIPPPLVEIIKRTAGDYQWLIKLHPAQRTGLAYRQAKFFLRGLFRRTGGVIEWEQTSELPLVLLLLNAALHITFNSASAIEAALVGVKTGLLDTRMELMRVWFGEYFRSGMIEILPRDPILLEDWIKERVMSHNSTMLPRLVDNGESILVERIKALERLPRESMI